MNIFPALPSPFIVNSNDQFASEPLGSLARYNFPIPGSTSEIEEVRKNLLNAIKKGDYSDPVFLNYPISMSLNLKMLWNEKKISDAEYWTITQFLNISIKHGRESIQVISIKNSAFRFLVRTTTDLEQFDVGKLNNLIISTLYNPPCEQFIFRVLKPIAEDDHQRKIKREYKFNFCGILPDQTYLIPSFSIMQNYLNVMFGFYALNLKLYPSPRTLLEKNEDVRDARFGISVSHFRSEFCDSYITSIKLSNF